MNRDQSLQALESGDLWDVLVIGGGASGLGAAVEAVARGYRTVLLEQHDFAKGTSSRSTKLIHGGVRYLKQGNISLVRDSLRERERLLHNAPHLVHLLPFIIPTHSRWEGFFYGTGLKAYDLLSGSRSTMRSCGLSHDETVRALPTVATHSLRGGVRYFDGQFDDARLATTLMRTLADRGGVALNYARVTRFLKQGDRICGAIVQDLEGGRELELQARVVINATGVFTDSLRRLDDAAIVKMVAASRGAHVVVTRSFLPGSSALMVPKTSDGRVLFAIPWHEHVIIGTTDSGTNDVTLEPQPLSSEIEFLLENVSRYLAKAPARRDILSAFVGLRPLVKAGEARNTAKLSRDHVIVVSTSGLVTLTGGKWTTYRKMGEDAVDHAAEVGGLEKRPSATPAMLLHGAVSNAKEPIHQAPVDVPSHWQVYGSDIEELAKLVKSNPAWNEPLHPRLPYRVVEVIWTARHEMARTVEDVLARRLRALFLDASAAIEMAPSVASLLRMELKRDADWERGQITAFTELAQGYLVS